MALSSQPDVTAPSDVAPPRMLHHAAYVTHDAAATVDFYTRVLRMKLVSCVIDDAIPSTGDPFPYIHLFFEMQDGSTIAFFESLRLPPPAPVTHPAYEIFNHFAFDVGSVDAVNLWAEHLREEGVDFIGPVDHGIIYSVYFRDPNNVRLELTANVATNWKEHGSQAKADVAAWIDLKRQVAEAGNDELAVDWIKARRGQHKQGLD